MSNVVIVGKKHSPFSRSENYRGQF